MRKPLVLAAMLLGVSASPAQAATINVTTTQDVPATNGECSLRGAVTAANTGAASGECPAADPSGTQIMLGSGNYVLTAGELSVSSSITIVGQGVGATTIDGDGLSRVLEVGSTGNLTLSGLTLTGGRAPHGANATTSAAGASGDGGGAVENTGTLTLNHVAVLGNRAGDGGAGMLATGPSALGQPAGNGGNGGGIESAGSSLTIVDSTIADNRAGDGGANGTLPGGNGGNGGGIDVIGGAVSITGSTLSANVAGNGAVVEFALGTPGGNGGGLALSDPAPGMLANDTIAGNTAGHPAGYLFLSSDGGGIYQTGGQLVLTQVTVARNTEVDYHGIGGNISTTGGLTVADSALEATCHGPVADGGHNFTLIPSQSELYYQRVCPGRQLQVGPSAPAFDLGPLQDNGGPTQTMLPGPGSALIGAVPRKGAGCLARDQRGVARPQGSACDAGAVEVRVPVVAVQPRPVRFRQTRVGHVLRKTIRVRVTSGERPLRLGSARITGRNVRDFAIVRNRCRGKTLHRGQSCTLVTSFTPRGRGVLRANVILSASSPGKPVKIALAGTCS